MVDAQDVQYNTELRALISVIFTKSTRRIRKLEIENLRRQSSIDKIR